MQARAPAHVHDDEKREQTWVMRAILTNPMAFAAHAGLRRASATVTTSITVYVAPSRSVRSRAASLLLSKYGCSYGPRSVMRSSAHIAFKSRKDGHASFEARVNSPDSKHASTRLIVFSRIMRWPQGTRHSVLHTLLRRRAIRMPTCGRSQVMYSVGGVVADTSVTRLDGGR